MPYEELLRELDLPLQFRSHREDIITPFKICKFYPDLTYICSASNPGKVCVDMISTFRKSEVEVDCSKTACQTCYLQRNGVPPHFAQIPNFNGLKHFIDDRFGLGRYTCRLPRSGLGPGMDVGLTDFGGAGRCTGVCA